MNPLKEKQSQALWEAARVLNLPNGSEISAIAVKLGLTGTIVKSILDMGGNHTSFEFAKVANYLLGDEWLSWEIGTKPFVSTITKQIVLREVFPGGK